MTVYNTWRFKVVQQKRKKNGKQNGPFGRFKNRIEAGKKVADSWDRDLSIGNVKW